MTHQSTWIVTGKQRAAAQQEQMERQQEQEDVYTTAQAAQAVRMVGGNEGA